MSDQPRMLSKREIELEELKIVENAQDLRDENQKLKEQLNTAKKALTEIAELDCSDDCYFTARDALTAIGGGDE